MNLLLNIISRVSRTRKDPRLVPGIQLFGVEHTSRAVTIPP